MVPPAKRKRPERQYPPDEGRPSPHRPESLSMAQHNQRPDHYGSGRGDSRRGRGGYPRQPSQTERRPRREPNVEPRSSPSNSTPASRSPLAQHGRSQPGAAAVVTPAKLPPPRAVVAARQSSPPPDPEETYDYEYLTDEVISAWGTGARDQCKEQAVALEDDVALSTWTQELVRSAIHRRIDPVDAGALYREIHSTGVSAPSHIEDVLVDTVSLLQPSDWRRLSLTQFITATAVSMDVWRLALDTDCVEALGMTRERFTKKKAAKITNYLYRQSNYNLLREESEGYAKLVTEYFNIAQNASASDSAPSIALDAFDRVKALVGSFDLDVGRVLDITLDVFANLLVRNFRFFVKFIRVSSWWPQLDCPDVIKWKGQGFDTLPDWALPTSRDWGVGAEELERTARLRPLQDARDVMFWQDVKLRGIDAFYEIGAKHITNFEDEAVQRLLNTEVEASKDDVDGKGVEKNRIKRLRINDLRKWMRTTKTLAPAGNPDAATLLGFKLSFYASPARDKEDVMPDNLIYLAALLIKIGFISLRDLYPHLHPLDEQMDAVKKRLEREQEERDQTRTGGVLNKLAMSGALVDDTLPPVPALRNLRDASSSKATTPKPESTPRAEEKKDELPDSPDQKILLLKSLLAIGALPEALFIIGRFPWLVELLPDLPDYVHRILHHMLSKVYEPLRPLQDREDVANPKDTIGDSAGLPKNMLNILPSQRRTAKRWANLDRPDQGDGVAYKFYWDDWTDNIPVCQSVDDVFLLCETFLNLTGVKIGRDPALLLKLVRIGKSSLNQDRSTSNFSRWADLSKRLLVPALSLTTKNPNVDNEVFSLLDNFPISTRYSIYAEWHHGVIARLPDIKRAFKNTRREALDVMKRISKENVRQMGKALAKAAYGSPGVVLQTAINQMESYDNMIVAVVECSKYFTLLGYDVLTWCLLNALGGDTDRNKIQADGMLTSPWLRALSTFAGALYKRYSACDPMPVLHYVASELRRGDTTNLELLEQMVTAMTGIKSDVVYNDQQVLAMAGGDVLQAQTLTQMADERHKLEYARPSRRLMKALTDSGLVGQLLISIAQERQMYTSRPASKNAPLKVIGSNVDKIHSVFVQYLEAFRAGSTTEQFADAVPGPVQLMQEFRLDVEIAFMIARPGIAQEVIRLDAARKAQSLEKSRATALPLAKAYEVMAPSNDAKSNVASDIASTADNATVVESKTNEQANQSKDEDVKMEDIDDKIGSAEHATEAATPISWHPALTPIVQNIPAVLGEQATSVLSVPFYVTFWTLDLQDMVISNSSYEQELSRQSAEVNRIKNNRADASALSARERERQIKVVNDLKERLTTEMRAQISAYTAVRQRLNSQKDHWFDVKASHKSTNSALLQYCFLPRIVLSSLDAYYTFTMIRFLHSNGTRGFYTMHLYDMIFDKARFSALLFSFTAREAENFGRFINEILKEVSAWHADKNSYEKNAIGAKHIGFGKAFEEGVPTAQLNYEDFRRLLQKWHNFINLALQKCFDSGEYMHIRNAIIALKAFHTQFPKVNFMGAQILKHLTRLSAEEERGDLKLAATSLLGNLKPLEKTWVAPLTFSIPRDAKLNGAAAQDGQDANNASKSLNAEATEFKPGTPNRAVSVPTEPVSNGAHDDEDGEIKDEVKHEFKGVQPPTNSNITHVDGAAEKKAEKDTSSGGVATGAKGPLRSGAVDRDVPNSLSGRNTPVSNAAQGLRPRPDNRSASRTSSRERPPPDERSSRSSGHVQDENSGRLNGRAYNEPPNIRGRSPDHRRGDDRQLPRQDARGQDRGPYSRNEHDDRPPLRGNLSSRDFRAPNTGLSTPSAPKLDDRDKANESSGVPSLAKPADSINPARLALIEDNRGPANARSVPDDKRDRAREPSPRRTARDLRPQGPASFRNDRGEPPAGPSGGGFCGDDRDYVPAAPRHDALRQDRGPAYESSRRSSSDAFSGGPAPRGHNDPNYGRLSQSSVSRESDPTYGRLKPPDAPSGPRSTTSNARPAPSGSQVRAPGNAPTTPQQASSGPSRGSNRSMAPGPPAQATPAREELASAAVHPSRLSQLGPIDTKSASSRPVSASDAQTPIGTSPAVRGIPAGPSSTARNDRRFAGLNDTLQQGSPAQGASIKGRATRSGSSTTPITPTGPTNNAGPVGPQAMAPPQHVSRASDNFKGPAGRGGPPLSPQVAGPRSGHDQSRHDYDFPSPRDGRGPPRNGPPSREPSREAVHQDYRRADYRGPTEADARSRPPSSHDNYRDYGDPGFRGGGYPRDDHHARSGPPTPRGAASYPVEPRGYQPQADTFATIRGGGLAYDNARGGDFRGTDGRGYGGARPADPRDDRGGGWGDRRDDPSRKRHTEEQGPDPNKRRRSGV